MTVEPKKTGAEAPAHNIVASEQEVPADKERASDTAPVGREWPVGQELLALLCQPGVVFTILLRANAALIREIIGDVVSVAQEKPVPGVIFLCGDDN